MCFCSIESLPEIERESILADRREEISRREQKGALLSMLQRQQQTGKVKEKSKPAKSTKSAKKVVKKPKRKAAAESDDEDAPRGAAAYEDESDTEDSEAKVSDYERDNKIRGSKRKRSAVGTSASKREKLKELSAKRRAKAAGSRRRASASDDEEGLHRRRDNSDFDSYTDSDEEDGAYTSKKSKPKYDDYSEGSDLEESKDPPSLEGLRRTQINRHAIVKFMHRPGWEKALLRECHEVSHFFSHSERSLLCQTTLFDSHGDLDAMKRDVWSTTARVGQRSCSGYTRSKVGSRF